MHSELPLNPIVTEQSIPSLIDHFNQKTQVIQTRRKVKLFVVLLFIITCLLGSVSFFLTGDTTALVQVIGLLVLGYAYTVVVKNYPTVFEDINKPVCTLILATGIFLILCAILALAGKLVWSTAIAGASAFALPYTLNELWDLFSQLSSGTYKYWSYTENLPMQKSTTFLNSMPIRFKIDIEQGSKVEHRISFRAPLKMKLGLIFYHMIQDQNNNGGIPIDLADKTNQSYQWIFSTTRFGLTKYLDPDSNLIESGIKQNDLVMARRISLERP
jgi:hypothetical protein